MLNMLDTQDNLKNFSEDQLIREMQMPSGSAPQFMVLGEIERRKRMRADSQRQQGLMQPTVAQEAVTAAGVPQQGIAGIAQSLAPQTDMTQNTGVPNVQAAGLPGQPNQPQRMADGGVLKLAPGGDLDPQSSILATDPGIINMASRSNMSVADYISMLPPEIRAERLRMRLDPDALYPDGTDEFGAPLYSARGFSEVAPTSSPQQIEDEAEARRLAEIDAGITRRVADGPLTTDIDFLNTDRAAERAAQQDAEIDARLSQPTELAVPRSLASGPDYADRFAAEPEYTFRGDVLPYLAGAAGDVGRYASDTIIDGVNQLGGYLSAEEIAERRRNENPDLLDPRRESQLLGQRSLNEPFDESNLPSGLALFPNLPPDLDGQAINEQRRAEAAVREQVQRAEAAAREQVRAANENPDLLDPRQESQLLGQRSSNEASDLPSDLAYFLDGRRAGERARAEAAAREQDPEGIETLLPPEVSPLANTPSSGTPSSGTPSSGTPSSGTPSSGTPSSGASDDEAPASGSNMDQDKWLALAQAGFTLMSTGDFGKAGQAGLAAYSQSKQAAQDARKLEAELAFLDARTQAALRPPSGGRPPRVPVGMLNVLQEQAAGLQAALDTGQYAPDEGGWFGIGANDDNVVARERIEDALAAVNAQISGVMAQYGIGVPSNVPSVLNSDVSD